MRTAAQSSSELVRRAHVTVVALGVLALLPACRSRRPAPQPADARSVAESATREGNWRIAAARWHDVYVTEGHDTPEPCIQAARAFLQLGDATSAINMVQMGLEQHPDHPDMLELRAEALVALGFRRAAEECYERLLALEPKRVSALIGLARLRIGLGREGAAVACLKQAIELTGGDAEAFALLAHALQASGDPCGALDAYQKTFVIRDGTLEELLSASALCMEEQVARAHPDVMESGVRWLEQAIERNPQSTQAHFQLAVLHEELGHTDQAIARYRRAIETDPACLMALTNLAILYASLQDQEHAAEIVNLALKLERDNNRRRALVRLLEPLEAKNFGTKKSAEVP